MTFYDVLAIVIILVSAVAGLVRGGAREIVTLFSFTLAALVSLLALPVTGPFFRRMINPDWVGTVTAVAVLFIVAYLAVRWFGAWASQRLQQTERLGGVDRSIGLGFGVLRALVVLGVFHLVFCAVTPPERLPPWFRGAVLYPVSAGAAKAIQAVLPHGAKVADRVAPRVEASVRRGASARPHSMHKSRAAYDEGQRGGMDALVERSR